MNVTIPFLDLKSINLRHRQAFHNALDRVLDSGWMVLGQEVSSFERSFSQYCGTKHCIGVGNGLDALHLVLRAWDIGPGDEVLVPSNTYIATWLAITHAGATPVPVEPNPSTHNLDFRRIEASITPKTRAIIPVHLYGLPCDMDEINAIAQHYGLNVLEDSAQAHGATYRGRKAGNLAHAAAFSFYPGKNLGALGDGGAITTNNDELAEHLRTLRNYGSTKKYFNDQIGFNSRLDELQAAFLSEKLQTLDQDNKIRQEIANVYLSRLNNISGLVLPKTFTDIESSWHLFVVRIYKRDQLMSALHASGIGTLIHYPLAPHLQKAYKQLSYSLPNLPIAEQLQDEVLSLPIGPTMTTGMAHVVCDTIINSLKT